MIRLDAVALGSSVALGSLSRIADTLRPYNRRSLSEPARRVGIESDPITFFPNPVTTLDRMETSEGPIEYELPLVLYALAYQRLGTLWYSGGTVKSAAMTLYTYVAQRDAYARFNCIGHYPDGEDLEDLRGHLLRVRWRFSDLEEL